MFRFDPLDAIQRQRMLAQITAEQTQQIDYSPRLNDQGRLRDVDLLKQAVRDHDERWFTQQLMDQHLISHSELSRLSRGGTLIKHTPSTAAAIVAESQFNRFYMLALAELAHPTGQALIVYRARASQSPRPKSKDLIGAERSPETVMEQLATVQASHTNEPLAPNSGLSLRLAS